MRLPGTFGSAWDVTSSTLSPAAPAFAFVAHSGAIVVEIASMVTGSALPIAKAQARPPITAIKRGRASARAGNTADITDIATPLADRTPCAGQRNPAAADSSCGHR